MSKIIRGSNLTVEVQILDESGVVIETSDPDEPFEFELGDGELPPSVEKALMGKEVGDVVEVLCPAGEAFGDPSPEAIVSVPLEEFPDGMALEKGALVSVGVEDDEGEEAEMTAVVVEISPEGVILDANHPLAGKAAMFKVTVLEIA